MYINNEDFEKWMQKLSKKLSEIGQDLKSLINTKEVFDPDEKLLDNQDLAFLLNDCSTLNVPPISLSNVPGISELNVPSVSL